MQTGMRNRAIDAAAILEETARLNSSQIDTEHMLPGKPTARKSELTAIVEEDEGMSGDQQDVRDRALIERFQTGDVTAFEELRDVHWERIHQLALRWRGDMQDADTLTQSIFADVKRMIGSWQAQRVTFGTWLYRVAINYLHTCDSL